MASLLESFQRMQKIESACLPKDDPAPVYLLDEILELARSSPEQAQAVADMVEKKLASKSPVVKFKALRVIKHLCGKGCSTFQRCMQRHSSTVRELVNFRGEPDPFKGDVPNARVREFAKEVLEVLFNANPVATSSATGSLAAQGRIQGFGSGGPGAEPVRSSYSSGGYIGGGGGGSGMGTLSSAAASMEGPLAAGVATVASAINDFLGNPSARAGLTGSRYGTASPTRNGRGGYGGFEPMGGYGGSSSTPAVAAGVSPSQVLGSEEGIVDDICTPGGLRPTPDAADLRRFVESASTMDGLRLAEVLRAKMEGAGSAPGSWQVALRALCALEAVLQRGSSQACGEVAVMFQSDPMALQVLATHQQQLVREAAARCLRQLLGEDAAPVVPAAPAAASGGKKGAKRLEAAAAPPTQDLLSLDDEAAPAPQPAPAAVPAAASAIDMLGDLMGPAPPAAAAAAGGAIDGADSMFSGLDVGMAQGSSAAAPAGAGTSAAPVVDLFGGLSLSPAAAPAPPAAAPALAGMGNAPSAAGKAAAPLDDLFAGITTSGPTASVPSAVAPQWQQQQQQQQQYPQQQQQQQQQYPQQQVAVHAQASAASGGVGIPGATLSMGQHPQQAMGGTHPRGMTGSGHGAAGHAAIAASAQQQPWSGGLTKDHAAFDFVDQLFSK